MKNFSLILGALLLSTTAFADSAFEAISCDGVKVVVDTNDNGTAAIKANIVFANGNEVSAHKPVFGPYGGGTYKFVSFDNTTIFDIAFNEQTEASITVKGQSRSLKNCKADGGKLAKLKNVGNPVLGQAEELQVRVVCSIKPGIFVSVLRNPGEPAQVVLFDNRDTNAPSNIVTMMTAEQVKELGYGLRRLNVVADNGNVIKIISDADILGKESDAEDAGWNGKIFLNRDLSIKLFPIQPNERRLPFVADVVCRNDA